MMNSSNHFHRILNDRKPKFSGLQEVKTPVIQVEALDWFPRENGAKHRTDFYELVTQQKACVLRRAEVFGFGIFFRNRHYDINRDRLVICVEFGTEPSVPEGTKAMFEMLQRREFCSTNPTEWEALFDRRVGHRLELLIRIPHNAPVGLWRLSIITWFGERNLTEVGDLAQVHHAADPFYVLFNPYIETDPVHFPHGNGRDDYLLADVGKIYIGSHNLVEGRPWVFGQYRDSMLPAVVYILDTLGKIKSSQRSDPVRVAREIALICSRILCCVRDGIYGNGSEPWQWTGSLKILESFAESLEPIKFGHCWVLAGLVTSMFRALGIPSRCVTNFVSGRDPDSSLSLQRIFKDDSDSSQKKVWSFHVWNEVWMRRDDLVDPSYNGWQAVDAYTADGIFPRGPTPVEAIRRGETGVGFDTSSFFSDLNAKLNFYLPDKSSQWGFSQSGSNMKSVGQLVVTQGPGYLSDNNSFESITQLYKNHEGHKERLSILGCNQSSAKQPDSNKGDVYFQILDLDKGNFGEDYNVSLFLHNQSTKNKVIDVSMETSSVFYSGTKAHLIKKGFGEFDLQPNERETLTMTVTRDEYLLRSVELGIFSNLFKARVRETGQSWIGEDDFVLQKPRLKIHIIPDAPRVRVTSKLAISFVNPLNFELSLSSFSIEAPGLVDPTVISTRPIAARSKCEVTCDVTAWKSGPTLIVATFTSKELTHLFGSLKVHVIS